MKTASIRRASMDAIVAQAEREFPFECCGFIIGDTKTRSRKCGRSRISRTRCTRKIRAAFPRDARTAFLMEPKAHLAVMNEVDRSQARAARRLPFASRPRRVLLGDRPRAGVLVRSGGARLSGHGVYRDVDTRGQVRARGRVRLGFREEGIRRDSDYNYLSPFFLRFRRANGCDFAVAIVEKGVIVLRSYRRERFT